MPRGSVTIVARSSATQTQGSTSQTSSSFFTFLIALLILVFASGALVLRAILIRRRFRRRLQEAIDAGILPTPPNLQDKPELYDVCIRSVGDAGDWRTILPICVTDLGTPPQKNDTNRTLNPATRVANRPSIAGRLMELLGHRYTRSSVTQQPVPSQDPDTRFKCDLNSTLQVAVLIAMPSKNPCVPPLESPLRPVSPKGKRRESAKYDDVVPDVMLGVNTFAVISDTDDS